MCYALLASLSKHATSADSATPIREIRGTGSGPVVLDLVVRALHIAASAIAAVRARGYA